MAAAVVKVDTPRITIFEPTHVSYSVDPKALNSQYFTLVDWDKKGRDWRRRKSCRALPKTGKHLINFVLVHFNRDISMRAALSAFQGLSLRPAVYEEGIGFANVYTQTLRDFPIPVLGTSFICGGIRSVLVLDAFSKSRMMLGFDWAEPNHVWLRNYRFLTVRT